MYALVEAMALHLAAVEREKNLQRLHADRRVLSGLAFTSEQLAAYQERIFGIETRLAAWRQKH